MLRTETSSVSRFGPKCKSETRIDLDSGHALLLRCSDSNRGFVPSSREALGVVHGVASWGLCRRNKDRSYGVKCWVLRLPWWD